MELFIIFLVTVIINFFIVRKLIRINKKNAKSDKHKLIKNILLSILLCIFVIMNILQIKFIYDFK
jgi:uncharacterized integral membrane protein